MSDKTEWVTKIKSIVDPKGLAAKKQNSSEGGGPMKQSHSDGSLVCCKTLHFCFVNGICNACIWFCPFISPYENSLSPGLLEAFHYSRKGWIMWHLLFILVKYFPFMYILSFQETILKKPVNPEEELRWISQEVRGYVEAVLNSLAANVPKLRRQSFSGFPNFFFMPCNVLLF